MDCRDFRSQHAAFMDGALEDAELVAFQVHLAECARCSRYDTAVRRGLLVLRNLPTIEPSPDFLDRLNERLHHLKESDARAAMYHGPGVGMFVATAASVVALGFLAALMFRTDEPARDLRLAPVVAMQPAPVPAAPVVSSDFVVSVSMGLPVWPAAMMAEQAPVHFANTEMEGR